jgi:undecaprenyl-diphosphatase
VPDLFKAVVLGIVQGLTEFLPVSSTGHLIITEEALGVSEDTFGLTFDAAIHLGTLAAVLIYFRDTFRTLVADFFSSIRARKWDATPGSRLAWLLVLGTIPAGIAGLLLENVIEDTFRSPALVAVMLIVFSFVLLAAERLATRGRVVGDARPMDALVLGVAQSVALIPGVSRAGITISAGMLRGFQRPEAAVFAFLLSAPVIAAAGGKQLFDIARRDTGGQDTDLTLVLAGMVTAAIVGYGAIAFLVHFLRGNPLYLFVIYRIALGALVLGLVAAGVL